MNWQPVLDKVKAALLRRGRSEHEADDLVQDAWMRLAGYQSSNAVARPEAFLMRTALNLSIDAHRQQYARGEEIALEDVFLQDVAPTIEEQVLSRERLERLSMGAARLTNKTRAIFLAHRMDGKTYMEIAAEQGLAVSTVERHVAKATMQLTAWMEGC